MIKESYVIIMRIELAYDRILNHQKIEKEKTDQNAHGLDYLTVMEELLVQIS